MPWLDWNNVNQLRWDNDEKETVKVPYGQTFIKQSPAGNAGVSARYSFFRVEVLIKKTRPKTPFNVLTDRLMYKKLAQKHS